MSDIKAAKESLEHVALIFALGGGAEQLRAQLRGIRLAIGNASAALNSEADGERQAFAMIIQAELATRDVEQALQRLDAATGAAHFILEKLQNSPPATE